LSKPIVNFTKIPLEELLQDKRERRYADLVLEACSSEAQSHSQVIHIDPEYRISLSTTINRILDLLVDNGYLKVWRNENHPTKERVFALQ